MEREKLCDKVQDCPFGSDENGCSFLGTDPDLSSIQPVTSHSIHQPSSPSPSILLHPSTSIPRPLPSHSTSAVFPPSFHSDSTFSTSSSFNFLASSHSSHTASSSNSSSTSSSYYTSATSLSSSSAIILPISISTSFNYATLSHSSSLISSYPTTAAFQISSSSIHVAFPASFPSTSTTSPVASHSTSASYPWPSRSSHSRDMPSLPSPHTAHTTNLHSVSSHPPDMPSLTSPHAAPTTNLYSMSTTATFSSTVSQASKPPHPSPSVLPCRFLQPIVLGLSSFLAGDCNASESCDQVFCTAQSGQLKLNFSGCEDTPSIELTFEPKSSVLYEHVFTRSEVISDPTGAGGLWNVTVVYKLNLRVLGVKVRVPNCVADECQ